MNGNISLIKVSISNGPYMRGKLYKGALSRKVKDIRGLNNVWHIGVSKAGLPLGGA